MGHLIPHVLSSVDKTNPTAKYLKVSELYFGSGYDEQCSNEHSSAHVLVKHLIKFLQFNLNCMCFKSHDIYYVNVSGRIMGWFIHFTHPAKMLYVGVFLCMLLYL